MKTICNSLTNVLNMECPHNSSELHIGLKLQFFKWQLQAFGIDGRCPKYFTKMVVNATGSLIVVYNKFTLYYHHLYCYIIFYARQPSDDYFIIATFTIILISMYL